MDHAEIMTRCGNRLFESGLSKLEPVETVIALASVGDFEIELGGIVTFLDNSAGDYSVETVQAFKIIGANEAAKALQAANELFPKGPPKDRERRIKQWESLRDQVFELNLDSQYYNSDPSVFTLLIRFMDENEAQLLKLGY